MLQPVLNRWFYETGLRRLDYFGQQGAPFFLATGDTAIRLGTFFKTSREFWMNLQVTYDLRNAEKALPAKVRKRIEDNRVLLAS